jgi:hypothetical protein
MKTIQIQRFLARGTFMGLVLAGTFMYSCENRQQGTGADAGNSESDVPAVTPSDSMNTGLNGREGGSDTIGRIGTATPPADGDTISIGTGATGGSGGTTGGGSGTPNDRTNPHVPANKQ